METLHRAIKMQELIALNNLAATFFTKEEYAVFLDLMERLRDRAAEVADAVNQETSPPKIKKKYSHDIKINLDITTYKNNHKGERIELLDFDSQELTVKIPLGQEPKDVVQKIKNTIKLETKSNK
jgi:hypothetical protein